MPLMSRNNQHRRNRVVLNELKGLADNRYSDSELPDIVEDDDDDDDEPVREPDAKLSRVNQDYPPMSDHLLPSDDEDIDSLS